ncbi:DUF5979 domain-containing protein, partial [Blautia sp. MSJ-9]|uniref:DUF5979 domain-containing protein n=1 Tax=Blautia sp. MSJ-9 TaxID=2841511 RepID=UPI001C11FE59
LPVGEYTVNEKTEEAGISGYGLAVTGTGKVTVSKGTTATAAVTNTYSKDKGDLSVSKKVEGVSAEGKNFKFTVQGPNGKYYDKDGAASDTETVVEVKAEETVTIKDLPVGEYTVNEKTEEAGISGYGLAVTGTGKVTVSKGTTATAAVTNTYSKDRGDLSISKKVTGTDVKGKNFKFTVQGPDGKYYSKDGSASDTETVVEVKAEETVTIKDLPVGEYTVNEKTEEAGISGYGLAVTGTGKVTVSKGTAATAAVTNTYSKDKGDLSISKKVIGTDVKGKSFKFTVQGPDGKYYSKDGSASDTETVVEVKAEETVTIKDLPVGEYTVNEKTEEAGISGYGLAVTGTGKVTIRKDSQAIAAVTNTYTKTSVDVKISKVDAETYKVLGGAHLMVIDPDGNVVAEWDSTKNAHKITGLKPGVTYTLRETKAPKGYDVAADTTFELNEDGTINTANTTTSISGDDLLVKDEKTVDKTVSVSVTKRLVTVDGQVIGAPDATYYVALYSDPDCTQRVSDVMALNYKNASVSTVTFTGLKKGQTYYVGECEADGTSYLANVNADGTLYTVDFSDGNTVEVTNNDGSKTIYFDNQFEKVPDGYYKEGELNITKKLVGGDGKAKNSSEIFYAGIFSDADFTQLSPDVSDNIVPLDLAGGSEVTSQVKVSIPESGSITLYVTEVDSKGNPVAGAASFKYDVSVDNMQVTFDDDNISADVVITNSENTPEVTPTPTTTTPNTPVTQSGSTTKSAVKTGDSTPIGMFVGLFAAAAVIAGAAVFFKRRKK